MLLEYEKIDLCSTDFLIAPPFCHPHLANNATKKDFGSAEKSEIAHCSRRMCLLVNQLLNNQLCNSFVPIQCLLWMSCPWTYDHNSYYVRLGSLEYPILSSVPLVTPISPNFVKRHYRNFTHRYHGVLRKKDLVFIKMLLVFYKIFIQSLEA